MEMEFERRAAKGDPGCPECSHGRGEARDLGVPGSLSGRPP